MWDKKNHRTELNQASVTVGDFNYRAETENLQGHRTLWHHQIESNQNL
jgi:hypothetical protein